jgi:UDP-3-O-[3-hydroxymyristoyl] N-acetylglucosamine deacetylase
MGKQSETASVLLRRRKASNRNLGRSSAFGPCDDYKDGLVTLQAFQHTVRSPALFAGVGVHTGAHTRVDIRPAPADHGVVFVRTDITDRDNRVPVSPEAVCKTQLGTVITNAAGVTVATIEHLMAALVMTGIDNAVVELDGPEMPIMDGSSLPFLRILDRAGKRGQDAARRYIEILEPVDVIDGDKRASLTPSTASRSPSRSLRQRSSAASRVDFAMDEAVFRRRAGRLPHLRLRRRRRGPARHGPGPRRLDGQRRGHRRRPGAEPRRPASPGRVRPPQGAGRHRRPLRAGRAGHRPFRRRLAGHGLNNLVVRALAAQPRAWRMRTLVEELAEAV